MIKPARQTGKFTATPIEQAQGVIQRVDTTGREIDVLLPGGCTVFDVPPDCPVLLRGEPVKLRLVLPGDNARITFARTRGMLVAQVLEVQLDSGVSQSLV